MVGFDPNAVYGETQKVPMAVPAGWRRVTGSEVSALPELRTKASDLRNTAGFTSMAYGTLTPFTASDGNTYATWIEQHYHEPGGPVKPWGLHHGVTLLAQKDTSVLSDEWLGVRFNG
jgi:hypothetical protein